jgi:hypothetical protein
MTYMVASLGKMTMQSYEPGIPILLDLSTKEGLGTGSIRLVEKIESNGVFDLSNFHYATSNHCWVDSLPFRLLHHNSSLSKERVQILKLPKTFYVSYSCCCKKFGLKLSINGCSVYYPGQHP